MYIKPTKTMTNFVKKALEGRVENVDLVSFNDISGWNLHVNIGEPSKHDYNNNGQLQAIRIIYFGKDYAVDKFLDKHELDAIFQISDKSPNGFIEAIREAVEL